MISIAIPAYKHQFLEKAIISVLNQTYSDFELIIVDDNSPFELIKIVNKFNDSRIRYYKNPINIGKDSLVKNWNECLKYARGEYFVLFSDDDIYNEDFLKELMELAQKYPNVNLFHCRVVKIDKLDNIIGFTPNCPEFETSLDLVWHTIHGFRNLYVTEFLCKTKSLRNIGGFYDLPLAWGSDYITWFQLSFTGGIVFSFQPLSYWRKSDSNISSIGNFEKRLEALQEYRKWLFKFLENFETSDLEEKEMIKECLLLINPFFYKKREHLMFMKFKNINIFKLIIIIPYIIKKYNLSFQKVFYYLIKSLR